MEPLKGPRDILGRYTGLQPAISLTNIAGRKPKALTEQSFQTAHPRFSDVNPGHWRVDIAQRANMETDTDLRD